MDNDASKCKIESTAATNVKSNGGTTSNQILSEKDKKLFKIKELLVVLKKIDTNSMPRVAIKGNKKANGNKKIPNKKNTKKLQTNKNRKVQNNKNKKITSEECSAKTKKTKTKIKVDLVSVDTVSEPSSSKSTNSHDSSTKLLTTATNAKRKRKNTRILKRSDIRKRNAARQTLKKRLTKIKKLTNKRTKIVQNDEESTTNSENSEQANLFNDINWEENLEIDASEELVEEFAPRPRLMSVQKVIKEEPSEIEESSSIKLETIEEEEEIDETLQPKKEEDEQTQEEEQDTESQEDVASPTRPSSNDNVEQEFSAGLQIHVKDYKTTEWNKASILEVDWEEEEVLVHYDIRKPDEWVSMSSQRLSRSTTHPLSGTSKLFEKEDIKIKETGEIETMNTEIKTNQEELIGTPKLSSADSTGRKNKRNRNPAKFRRYRNSRKNWRFKRQSSLESSSKFEGKFKVGEKVLAKWSNHRMQKFPAVIKSISGKGAYDLLFYDGFEKTINEDHIFKTTEEEAAKYQDSKPSEADSFVDMEADSKEARRQRKRKTFDDYVFAKDLKRKRRSKCVEDETSKQPSLQSLHTHCRKGRKRKKLLSDKEDDEAQSPMNDSGTNDYENSNMAGTDSDNYHELFGESEDRWTGEISPDAKPLNIECSDGIRKSVVVPDKVLPLGWTKQCINRTGQMWETFLISPEGYRLNTKQDLKEYSREILGSRTPRNLDFLVNTKILTELIGKQENLQPVNNWLPWIGKSGKKNTLLGGTSAMSPLTVQSHCRVGRVRTLLPKCRTPQNVTTNEPPAATFSEIWRCPKQGCDKKFRKENLLQMHIKHYHVEFTALVGSAPNVVDLACARSEIVNAEHIKSLSFPPKKLLTKMPSQTPPHTSDSSKPSEIDNSSVVTTVSNPQAPVVVKTDTQDNIANKTPLEQRKSTIKTMLPLRQSAIQDTSTTPSRLAMADSDDVDSDDGQSVETKPFKPGRGRKKTEKKLNSDSYTEEEKTSPNTEATTDEGGVVIERLKSEEIINCICGFREEDGLMIQCDICMCWQHGMCSGVESDSDVPDRYVCQICRQPPKVRSSKKYSYALHYLSQGKLPSFSFRTKDEKDIQQREMLLKRCYELSSSLRQIQNVERSLKAKINIAEQAGHPKLYLWAKNWDETNQISLKTKVEVDSKDRTGEENGNAEDTEANKSSNDDKPSGIPQPEAPIDLEECRMKLLDHIDNYYQQLDDRLMSLQTQIAALESQDADLSSNVVSDKLMKQTILMLLRDLKTVQKIAAVAS
ncbi:PHD finger protein MBD-R2 isoform X3 [Rhodnius prolixus]|uniref:PHD finger protein MBD-R2 isoform X3 n=1 Tax=Rhodnius prolixus TaxID=13249 RepID=UPI003D18D543